MARFLNQLTVNLIKVIFAAFLWINNLKILSHNTLFKFLIYCLSVS